LSRYVRGEGVGALLMRPLDDACDGGGDATFATVLGSAVNQDGHSNG
jgi:acyl transferase domain-containing protein